MTLRKRLPLAGLAMAASAVLAVTVSTAGTATAATPLADPDGTNCVIDLDDLAQEGVCFATEDDATAYVEAQADYVLLEVYDWIGLNADGPHAYYVGNAPCTPTTDDIDHTVPTLYELTYNFANPDSVSMNDSFSSVITHEQCDIRLSDWVNNNPDGPRSGWIDHCTNLTGSGAGDCPTVLNWNNRASSFMLS
ncbi:hypothetical protein E1265_04995 [Streptomyces sp. 8K308]|uniref:hypothetical protein n=1 Tax=Streptomyces sp. 8K308 TaxID=2530388 RepID=UPI0010474940|nr:hypothetical protein [Streptomyces sp. 8K308]TDC26175.1 hypothetical protein E1265_04995 [Streptomyces sp. 8K308]